MTIRTIAVLAVLSSVAVPSAVLAQSAGKFSVEQLEASCSALMQLDVTEATITSATLMAAGRFTPPPESYAPDLAQRAARMPAFCRVEIKATPTPDSNIGIEVWLPVQTWNGRLLGTGNGGPAGSIAYGMGMIEGLRRGFAVANTDMGTAPDVDDAADKPERWADFGYRATHEMTRVAKQLVSAFYGSANFRSYFEGCSTGGQQALSTTQRYPDDYDGVLVGDPGNNRTHVHTSFLWNANALNATSDSRLSDANLSMISKAVIASCGGKDGGAPGDAFLTDPRQCRFDPETLPKCEAGKPGDNCLTAPQLTALRKLYAGPTNPRTGEQIYPPLTVGSEDQPLGPSMAGDPVIWPALQYYPFRWALGSDFDPKTFDFDRDLDRVDALLSSRVNVNGTDMADFRRRGGKLMLYTGLADPAVPFQEIVNYYERAVASRGDLAATQDYFRLYLVPGMAHCFGGPGATDFGQPFTSVVPDNPEADGLMSLVRWVEDGVAPDRLVGTRYDTTGAIDAQRPICTYPALPHYTGGDPTSAASFQCVSGERGSPLKPADRYLN